jgi:glycosyltransferase involved in cell wall biosynthesis
MLVSVIVPAYKQEKTILNNVKNIYNAMSQTRWDFELIVVVDGFADRTFGNARRFKRANMKVVGYKTNKGKGYAIRYGIARAKGDLISFIDSGVDIDPNGISMLLEHMQWYDADIIVGSKRHPVSVTDYPLIRRIYSWGYYTIIRILFGLRLHDTQTGLKVFRRKVLEKVLPRLLVKEFAFDIEMLAVARHLGFRRIYEAPVKINWDFKHTAFESFLFLDPYIRRMIRDTLAVFYRLYILRFYDDRSKRRWIYDKELDMKINTGEMGSA